MHMHSATHGANAHVITAGNNKKLGQTLLTCETEPSEIL